jgi:hypothetical protein
VQLEAGATARVGARVLTLTAGTARLRGDGASLDGEAAKVTMLGAEAESMIERRRPDMTRSNLWMKWTGPALMAVTVLSGGARVQAQAHPSVVLAHDDRMLVAQGLPPLVTRAASPAATTAPVATPAKTLAKTPGKAPAATPAPSPSPSAKPATSGAGQASATPDPSPEMKDKIRTSVRAVLGDLKSCYETVLAKDEQVAGRMLVRMRIVPRDDKGRVAEAEVVPQDTGDVARPAFEQCVLEVLSKADFPRPDGDELNVDYPFVFAPNPPDGAR